MTSGASANATAATELATRLVLDTSAYSRFRSGDRRVRDLIAAATTVLVPATVLGELFGAFELGSRGKENRISLSEFLAEPFVSLVPTSLTIARHYGRIYFALRRAGTPIPVNDMWIAACAVDQGACLLTFDGDFKSVPGIDYILLEGIEPGTEE